MTNQYPRYPEIEVELTGCDGNAYAVIGKVRSALRRGGVPNEKIVEYQEEAMSGDYDHLLQTAFRWVNVS